MSDGQGPSFTFVVHIWPVIIDPILGKIKMMIILKRRTKISKEMFMIKYQTIPQDNFQPFYLNR